MRGEQYPRARILNTRYCPRSIESVSAVLGGTNRGIMENDRIEGLHYDVL